MKSIKSIRIVDSNSPSIRQKLKETRKEDIFSFSKKDKCKEMASISEREVDVQRKQLADIERMIKGMLRKC